MTTRFKDDHLLGHAFVVCIGMCVFVVVSHYNIEVMVSYLGVMGFQPHLVDFFVGLFLLLYLAHYVAVIWSYAWYSLASISDYP